MKYFDSRDKEEETPYEIDEDIQHRHSEIEEIFFKIAPENSIEIAKNKSLGERTELGLRNDDNFVYGEIVILI